MTENSFDQAVNSPNQRESFSDQGYQDSHIENEYGSDLSSTKKVTLSKMDAYGVLTLFFAMLFPFISLFTGWKAWKEGDTEFSKTLGKWGFIVSIIATALVVLYMIFIFFLFFVVGISSSTATGTY